MSPGAEGGESGANSFWWKQHHGVGWHLQNKVLLHSGPSSSWTGFVGSAARLDPIPCSKTALQETVAVQPASSTSTHSAGGAAAIRSSVQASHRG